MTPLDKLEHTARGLQEFGGRCNAVIELPRAEFNVLAAEIEEEYDLRVSNSIRIVPEVNELSCSFGVTLHNVKFTFKIIG